MEYLPSYRNEADKGTYDEAHVKEVVTPLENTCHEEVNYRLFFKRGKPRQSRVAKVTRYRP